MIQLVLVILMLMSTTAWALTPSGPITVNTSNAVITGLKITGSGDCVTITGSATNITIKESEIGPCTGNGIKIVNGTNHKIYDNYIHPERRPSGCCDTGDGIWVTTGAGTGIEIQGNVICFGESNIEIQAPGVLVHGNYVCNPQGNQQDAIGGGRAQNIAATIGSSNVTVTSNFVYSCERAADGLGGTTCPSSPNYPMSAHQEDSINFWQSSNGLVQNNYIIGGTSTSGTAIINDGDRDNCLYGNGIQIRNNIIHNTAHAGPAVVGGANHIIDGNKVQNACLGGWDCTNDTAVNAFNNSPNPTVLANCPCGPITVSNNIADQTRPANNSVHSSYWGGSGCPNSSGLTSCCAGTGTTLTGNTFDVAAFNILNPIETTNPVPKIPPVPKNCTAVSPYTNQTTPALCGATLSAAPTVTITTDCGSGAGANCTVATTPFTTLAGLVTDDGAVTVTWACPGCPAGSQSGTATCAGCGSAGTNLPWSVTSIGLNSGSGNVITVTATDADSQTATDTITVTYTPAATVPTVLRLVR